MHLEPRCIKSYGDVIHHASFTVTYIANIVMDWAESRAGNESVWIESWKEHV